MSQVCRSVLCTLVLFVAVQAQAQSPLPVRRPAQIDDFDSSANPFEDDDSVEIRMSDSEPPSDESEADYFDDGDGDETAESQSQINDEQKELEARQRATNRHLLMLAKPLSSVQLVSGIDLTEVPQNRAPQFSQTPARLITATGATRQGPDRYSICQSHRPLYFEDANAERCGISRGCWENKIQAVCFLTRVLTLPYQLAAERADCLVCSRGDCKSCQSYPCEAKQCIDRGIDRHGLLTEAAAVAGFSFLLL